jgi:hypothetical protein
MITRLLEFLAECFEMFPQLPLAGAAAFALGVSPFSPGRFPALELS